MVGWKLERSYPVRKSAEECAFRGIITCEMLQRETTNYFYPYLKPKLKFYAVTYVVDFSEYL